MIKNLLLFMITIAFLSCDSISESRCLSYYNGVSVDFYVRNAQGEDLLNPQNPNHLDLSKIKLFYVLNGVTQEYYKPNLDSPRGFRVYNSENNNAYKIRIEMNNFDTSEKRITYIQWDDGARDTFESTFEVADCYTIVKQVWLNGKMVLDKDADEGVCPVIVK